MPDLFEQIYGIPSAQPASLLDSIYGAPPPQAQSLLTPITTAVGTAFEVLNRPSKAVAESVLALQQDQPILPGVQRALAGDSDVSFEDVLEQRGMEAGLGRTLAGFGLDVVTDPLNLVGGLPLKAIRAIDKLPPLVRAAERTKEVPIVRALGERFVPHFGLPEDYRTARRLLDSEVSARKADAFGESLERYKKVSPEEGKKITLSLDKPGGTTGDARLDELAAVQRKDFETQKLREVEAKVLDPESAVENYVTYLFGGPVGASTTSALRRNLSAKNPFANPRDLVSIEQALYLGAEPHIARIAAVRKASGERAIAVAKFFEKAVKDFSVPKEAAPLGFRSVNIAGEMPIKEIFKGRYFDPDVARDLEKLSKVGETRDALDNAFRIATGVWKGYATAVNPGFHFRNLISNVFNSWLGGMSLTLAPVRYAEAAAWGAGKRIGKHTPEEINNAMKYMGVTGSGHGAFGEVASELDDLTIKTRSLPNRLVFQRFNPGSRFNFAQIGGRATGQVVEDLSRKALFLDQLHKGKSLEEAALHVKKYLFDYAELTDFERGIRDYAVPFYTWLRKNLPLQLESLLGQPQKYAHTGKAFTEIEEMSEEEGIRVPEAERPEWLQRLNALQLPTQTTTGEKVFFNPDLPYQDLNLVPADAAKRGQIGEAFADTGNQLLAMLNPALKIPIEMALNREAFTGREVVDPILGDDQLVRAPGFVSRVGPNLGIDELIGMERGLSRRGEEQWMMPARAAYLANQLPFFTKLGKVISDSPADEQGDLIGKFEPRHLGYLGFGFTPVDQMQQVQNLVAQLREQAQRTRGLNRQGAMLLPRPDDPTLYERLVLELVLGGQF